VSETETPKSTAITISAGPRGLQLNTMKEMWQFANALTASGMAPRGLEKPEACLVAMQLGAELGFGPMMSIQNIAVINGRPTVWGDVMLGLCRSSGIFDEEAFSEVMFGDENSADWAGICQVRRLPDAKAITRSFSVRDAKRAGLWDKKGPWQQYPQRMLQMRARSWALRDAFPDVLKGVYSAEEARDIVVETVPSEEHLAQAREAREAEAREAREAEPEPGKEANVQPVAELVDIANRIYNSHSFDALEDIHREIQACGLSSMAMDWLALLFDAQRAKIRDELGEEIDASDKVDGKMVSNEAPDVGEADPGKEADVQPVADTPEPTSDSEEGACERNIEAAKGIRELDKWQDWVDSHGILTGPAKERLTAKIGAAKMIIRSSRGSRSNN